MKLSRNRDGWVGRPMVGQVPVQAGFCTHGSVCAVLRCVVPLRWTLQGIRYRARQGSTGVQRKHTWHTALNMASNAAWHLLLLLFMNYKVLRDTCIDVQCLLGMNLRLSPMAALRAIHNVTSQVAGTYCQIRSHVWHMSVHCSPIAACTARYRLLGLPHPDVLNSVFSSATVPTKQQMDYTINRSKRPAPIAISGDCAAPQKSQKRHCVRMSLGRSDRRPPKRVSSRESAIRAFVLPRPLARFFAGERGRIAGCSVMLQIRPSSHRNPRAPYRFPSLEVPLQPV